MQIYKSGIYYKGTQVYMPNYNFYKDKVNIVVNGVKYSSNVSNYIPKIPNVGN